ncbi:hypothetical protein [Azospirillum sp. B4]|nr:hypothetical protein [Azospirillum sp. B4]
MDAGWIGHPAATQETEMKRPTEVHLEIEFFGLFKLKFRIVW